MSRTPVAVIEAFETGPTCEGPGFAIVLAAQSFLETLVRLRSACNTACLSEARVSMAPDAWEDEEQYRLTEPELVVTKTHFWFVDSPKHWDHHITTRAVEIEDFIARMTAQPQQPACFGHDDSLFPGYLDRAAELLVNLADVEVSPASNDFTLSSAQRLCAETYCDGEFSHVADCKTKHEFQALLATCGDGLFAFLMSELAVDQDCVDMNVAAQRLETISSDVAAVQYALNTANIAD